MPAFPRILTPRLVLRRFEERDLDALLAYRNDPQVEPWQGWGQYDEERGRALLAAFMKAEFGVPSEGHSAQVAFELRATGSLVGDVMLRLLESEPDCAVIGYTIAPAHQRQGLAREGVSALLSYAVPALGLRHIEASTLANNVASCALLSSLGFREAAGAAEDERRFVLEVNDAGG